MEKILFGWIATSFNLIYKLPQIYKLYKTNDARGISIKAYVIQTFSYFFYMLHGVFNKDYPIIVMGVASFIQCLVIIKLWYRSKNTLNPDE
jgi:uncharacterized protein with PQ loop repeat